VCANDSRVSVQWGASVEVVTGTRLVLFVVLSTSRWGRRFRRPLSTEPEPRTLTRREREIVRLVANGSSGPEIASELHIAHDTVRTHVRNAMTKLGARSRAHLVAKALGDGLTLD
jgi:DNA-binding NarL/FixJ family response regulator